MSKTMVINLTRVTQHPAVRHPDNKVDYIQIVGQGRTELREGLVIDPRWLQKNPKALRIVIAAPVAPTSPQAVVAPAPAPKTDGDK